MKKRASAPAINPVDANSRWTRRDWLRAGGAASLLAGMRLPALAQPASTPGPLPLSPLQREYLAAHPSIVVGQYDSGWPPFESLRDGRQIGLGPDYLSLLARQLGVKVEARRYSDWTSVLDAACRGEIDVVMNVALNADRAREEAAGHIRWLRPDYQNPAGRAAVATGEQTTLDIGPADTGTKAPWPKTLPEQIAAVRATRQAAELGTSITRAGLLPRVVIGGSISENTLKQQSTGKADYDSTQWTAKATLPLFRWDTWHQHKAAKAQRSQAEASADDQLQGRFLSIAEAYFNVLRAADNLTLAQAQEAGLTRQREQADARFKVGLIAGTDVIEAEAQRDGAVAQRLGSEIELNSARETLYAALGQRIGKLDQLRDSLPTLAPVPDDAALRLHAKPELGSAEVISANDAPVADVLPPKGKPLPVMLLALDITALHIAQLTADNAISYLLRFGSRQSVWRYYLCGDNFAAALRIRDLTQSGASQTTEQATAQAIEPFVQQADVTLANGRSAKVFDSTKPLALAQQSPYRFALVSQDNQSEKILIKRLPVAAAGQCGMAVVNGVASNVAEIYLNY